MKNFIQKSFSFDYIATSKLYSGIPFVIGSFIAIPINDANPGELVTVQCEGVFLLNITGQVNIGDVVYLHTDGTINTNSQNGIVCGFSLDASTGGATRVMLNKTISSIGSLDLSGYLKISDFNSTLIKACTDPNVIKSIQQAAKPS